MYNLVLTALFILASTSEVWGDVKCQELLTNIGFACMCNSEYCDTTPETTKLKFGSVYQITTAKTLPGFNKKIIKFNKSKYNPRDSNVVVINDEKEYQKLIGFGGSFTDSFGMNLLSLSEKTREVLLKSYFGKDGLRYNLCRVPVGGTDFSKNAYTYDDVEDDVNLTHFKLNKADFVYKIPFIKRANELRNKTVRLMGTNWSPPLWMKYKVRSPFSYLKDEYYQTWADYQMRFFSEYRKLGIEFWGTTPVNEPLTGINLHLLFSNLIMFPEQQAKWIGQYYGPTLKSNGFGDLKIITLDDQRKHATWWMDIIMADKDAREYVSGIGLHWYDDHATSANMMDKTHEKHPDKFILYTEASVNRAITSQPIDFGSWFRGALYAYDIIENLNHWAIGWMDWNMALNMTGGPKYIGGMCDSTILVDKEKDVFYKQPMYYVFGHFSAFTSENSTRIELLEFNLDHLGQNLKQKNKKINTKSEHRIKLPEKNGQSNKEKNVDRLGLNLNYVPDWPNPYLPDPNRAPVAVPEGVYKTATKNKDGSTTIFLLNGYHHEANLTLIDKKRGNLYLTLEPDSMNSFIYW